MRFMERSRLTIEAITALCKREFSVCVNATALKSSDTKPTTRRVVCCLRDANHYIHILYMDSADFGAAKQ